MKILIRHVQDLKSSYGETSFPSMNRVVITIARKKNKRLATYAGTMLHEMLHVWTHILEVNGFKMDNKTEHKFVYAAEKAIVKKFKRYAKKPKGK